jgi:PAS domain S-box-containing protein
MGSQVAFAAVAALPGGARVVHWTTLTGRETRLVPRPFLGFVGNLDNGLWTDGRGRARPFPAVWRPTGGQVRMGMDATDEEHAGIVRTVPLAPWRLLVCVPLALALDPVNEELRRLALAGALFIVVLLGLTTLFVTRTLMPLAVLSSAADRAAQGDASALATPPQGSQAVDRLAVSIQSLSTRLDISRERRRAVESRYRSVFDSFPLPAWIFDAETLRIVEANDAAPAHYGYTREEFLGLDIAKLRRSAEVPRMRAQVRAAATVTGTGIGVLHAGQWTHLRKDGTELRVEPVTHEITWAGRRAHLVVVHDVTERERLLAGQREADLRYRHLVQSSPVGILIGDTDGRALGANPAFVRLLGCATEAEALAAAAGCAWLPDDARAACATGMAADGRASLSDVLVRTRDGVRRWVTMTSILVPREGDGPQYVETFATDITEQRTVARQYQQAMKMEAVGQLAAGVAHDFNNLLTVILGFTDAAADGLAADDPRAADLAEVTAAARSATALARQLLLFARQDTVTPGDLDVRERITDARRLLRRAVPEHVALAFELCPDAGVVRMDVGQFEQVLLNLTVNARDAMPDGGTLTVRARAASHALGGATRDCVLIEVSDTGVGMSPEVQARIFEPFFTTKPRGQGTGLGLASVYAIIARAGGTLEVESVEGRGSTFRVVLPRTTPLTVVSGTAEPAPTGAPAPVAEGALVLVAEDDAAVRATVAAALVRHGYRVLEASDGANAVALARSRAGEIRLLLADVVLPNVSGRSLADEVLLEQPAARILFMSGYAPDALQRFRLEGPATAFISKPFTSEALLRKVRQVLDPAVTARSA